MTEPAYCANGDGNLAVGESTTGIVMDEDLGLCEVVELLCEACLAR